MKETSLSPITLKLDDRLLYLAPCLRLTLFFLFCELYNRLTVMAGALLHLEPRYRVTWTPPRTNY
jgi:hypothetical protein